VGPDPQTKAGNLTIQGNLITEGILKLGQFAAAPDGAQGALYFNTADKAIKVYSDGEWSDLAATDTSAAVPDGMVAMFSTDCPDGWVRITGSDDKLLRGDSAYGGQGNITATAGSDIIASYINLVICAKGGIISTAPTSLTATDGFQQIVLNWSAPSDDGGSAITNYKIYRGTSSGTETYLGTIGNVLTYTNSSLTNYATYYYKVTAVNSIAESDYSNESNATTLTYCDEDNDGHYTKILALCPSGRWSATAGDDCCDSDSRAYSGATAYYTLVNNCGSWDYDCNGANDKQWDCLSTLPGGAACSSPVPAGIGGYVDSIPECGVAGVVDCIYCWPDTNFCPNACYRRGNFNPASMCNDICHTGSEQVYCMLMGFQSHKQPCK